MEPIKKMSAQEIFDAMVGHNLRQGFIHRNSYHNGSNCHCAAWPLISDLYGSVEFPIREFEGAYIRRIMEWDLYKTYFAPISEHKNLINELQVANDSCYSINSFRDLAREIAERHNLSPAILG